MHSNQGHRQRIKDRFRKEGLENFHEVHALELLLFYAIPQKDTKALARELLDQFGSLNAVLEATPAELETVPGIGQNIATFLTLILEIGRYYQRQRVSQCKILDSVEKYGQYLVGQFYGKRNETVYLLCMDAKYKLLCCRMIGEGDVNSANIPVRKLVETALGVNATSVVLAHNHPSGLAIPSKEDGATTENLAKALSAMGIILLDHVVVADDDYISLAQTCWYDARKFYDF